MCSLFRVLGSCGADMMTGAVPATVWHIEKIDAQSLSAINVPDKTQFFIYLIYNCTHSTHKGIRKHTQKKQTQIPQIEKDIQARSST